MSTRRGTVLRCDGIGQELKTDQVKLTAGPGETLVELRAAALTQLDRTVLAGKVPEQHQAPFVPGAEGAGTVLESDRYEPGTEVIVRGGGIGVTRDGTWSTHVVAPDASVHPLPAGLDPVTTLGLLPAALTAHTAVRRVGQVQPGEIVAVTGIGSLVAHLCAAVARAAGATKVVGLAWVGDHVETTVVDQIVRVDELGQVGRELPWCNAAIDTVGGPVSSGVLGHLTPGGRLVVLGYSAGEFTTLDLHQLIGRDLRVLPVNMQRTTIEAETVAEVLADIATVRVRPDVEVLPAGQVSAAIEHLPPGDRRILLNVADL